MGALGRADLRALSTRARGGGGGMSGRVRSGEPTLILDAFAAREPGGGIARSVRDLAGALATRADAPPVRFAYPAQMPGADAPPWDPKLLLPLPGDRRRRRWTYLASTLLPGVADAYYGNPDVVRSPGGYGPAFARARH